MAEVHFFKARLVKGGPFIGVKTWLGAPLIAGEELDRSWRWQALVRMEDTGRAILYGEPLPVEIEGLNLRGIERVREDEYRFLLSHATYSTAHAPMNPDASPQEPVDFMKLTPF